MPARGQTCANCAGDCCSIVSFTKVSDQLNNGVMDFTVRELVASGYKEVYRPHKPCIVKTKEGCTIYDDRPNLCRSYYCHGKYWRSKD
jgi:hypothetical protein